MFDDFRFEQSDDGFGQSVVAAVPDASDRNVDSGFGGVSRMAARTMSQKERSYA